jgi:hypothetical protein
LFIELMAEMRNPREFWKSFLMAWSIIVVVHMTFGLYVYSQQGQFTYIPAVQGIGSYVSRTVGNSINITVHVVAAAVYGNVCLKSLYYPIVVDRLRGPSLETHRGHLIWSLMAIGLWIGAFLIASAIPNFGDLVGVVASSLRYPIYLHPSRILCHCGVQTQIADDLGPGRSQILVQRHLYCSCLSSDGLGHIQQHSVDDRGCASRDYSDCFQLSVSSSTTMMF